MSANRPILNQIELRRLSALCDLGTALQRGKADNAAVTVDGVELASLPAIEQWAVGLGRREALYRTGSN
jgi:hypothetical protein